MRLAGRSAWHGVVNSVGAAPPGAPTVGSSWARNPLAIDATGRNQALTDKILAAILTQLPRH